MITMSTRGMCSVPKRTAELGDCMHKKTPTKGPGLPIIAEDVCLDVEGEQIDTHTIH